MTILSMTLNKCTADMVEYYTNKTPVDGALLKLQFTKAVLLLDGILDRIEALTDILEELEDNDNDAEDSDF